MARIPGQSDIFAGFDGPGAVCRICNRVLTNKNSRAAGIGPVCAGGNHISNKGSAMPRARFTAEVFCGVICVEDADDGSKSVTNDAENVIADLAERGFDLTMPVIYRDTMGRWDRLGVTGGRFSGFWPLGFEHRDDAVRAVLADQS